jgi:hypothetical protein
LLRSQRKQEKKGRLEIQQANVRNMAEPNPFKHGNKNSTNIDRANAHLKQAAASVDLLNDKHLSHGGEYRMLKWHTKTAAKFYL